MALENIELWIAIAAVWATQIKILFDLREMKQCIKIEKHASFVGNATLQPKPTASKYSDSTLLPAPRKSARTHAS